MKKCNHLQKRSLNPMNLKPKVQMQKVIIEIFLSLFDLPEITFLHVLDVKLAQISDGNFISLIQYVMTG